MSDLAAVAAEATTTTQESASRHGLGTKLGIAAAALYAVASIVGELADVDYTLPIEALIPVLAVILSKAAQAVTTIRNGGTFVIDAPQADPEIPEGEAPAEPTA